MPAPPGRTTPARSTSTLARFLGSGPAGARGPVPRIDLTRLMSAKARELGRDLTAAARAGRLDPMIGRADEIEQTIEVLSRRTKNDPVLIGEVGVGKTAVVEGIAPRIVDGDPGAR